MYESKKELPLKVRIQIYHSFVQLHINYYSLLWGFCSKANIESLFRAQNNACGQLYPVSLTIGLLKSIDQKNLEVVSHPSLLNAKINKKYAQEWQSGNFCSTTSKA